ncbi:MAG TPA: class I SAM-dependent methyltransferase [Aggregatilineales bacterium]|nr:class I SAM-dependent methyltransferase [Aggregatilineales bacterium]
MVQNTSDVRAGYDRVAGKYAEKIFDELKDKPLDRDLLNRFAEQVCGLGPACDMGCGPGQIARYLRDRGVDTIGIDLSSGMVEVARRLNPDIEFRQGSMVALHMADSTLGGIAAFYSIIHIPREDVVNVLREFRRVLRPNGRLLLAFHIGQDVLRLDEWWGERVSIDFFYFTPDEMEGYLRAAGFEIDDVIQRKPYRDVEHQSRRAYIVAHKP